MEEKKEKILKNIEEKKYKIMEKIAEKSNIQ